MKRFVLVAMVLGSVSCQTMKAAWTPSQRRVGDSLGDPCNVDSDCNSEWCVNRRCDRRDG